MCLPPAFQPSFSRSPQHRPLALRGSNSQVTAGNTKGESLRTFPTAFTLQLHTWSKPLQEYANMLNILWHIPTNHTMKKSAESADVDAEPACVQTAECAATRQRFAQRSHPSPLSAANPQRCEPSALTGTLATHTRMRGASARVHHRYARRPPARRSAPSRKKRGCQASPHRPTPTAQSTCAGTQARTAALPSHGASTTLMDTLTIESSRTTRHASP